MQASENTTDDWDEGGKNQSGTTSFRVLHVSPIHGHTVKEIYGDKCQASQIYFAVTHDTGDRIPVETNTINVTFDAVSWINGAI